MNRREYIDKAGEPRNRDRARRNRQGMRDVNEMLSESRLESHCAMIVGLLHQIRTTRRRKAVTPRNVWKSNSCSCSCSKPNDCFVAYYLRLGG